MPEMPSRFMLLAVADSQGFMAAATMKRAATRHLSRIRNSAAGLDSNSHYCETVSMKGFTPFRCSRKRSGQSLQKQNRAIAFNDVPATYSI